MAQAVTDFLSNTNEQLAEVAKAIGRNVARQAVFNAIYYHKSPAKSVSEIVDRTHLTRKRVLTEGRYLATKAIVNETRKDGERAYEKIDSFHAHKKQILKLAASPSKRAALPTKRSATVTVPRTVTIRTTGAKVDRLTIDDIDTFSKVRRVKSSQTLSPAISETQFKNGVQAIIGEPGVFKDWGGERSDLYSTRIYMSGKRRAAAFAFKGPGLKTKLVPGKMGKNGDQAQRLFQEEADAFLVQHWREIDPSVVDLMRSLAVAKSALTRKKVWYGIIDGSDSQRLLLAYPASFAKRQRTSTQRISTRKKRATSRTSASGQRSRSRR
jgi:hypothetical protein